VLFRSVLAVAEKNADKKALAELKLIGPPPYTVKKTGVERKWVAVYGGTVYRDLFGLLGTALINNSEYTFEDKYIKFAKGSLFSLTSTWDELVKGDLFKTAASWKVPVYIIAGRHDMTVVPSQVEKYFKFIKAPKKEFFWFENSAHMCPYEEPEKYMDIMVNRVLKENEKGY
jgi:proline iminopeptidase